MANKARPFQALWVYAYVTKVCEEAGLKRPNLRIMDHAWTRLRKSGTHISLDGFRSAYYRGEKTLKLYRQQGRTLDIPVPNEVQQKKKMGAPTYSDVLRDYEIYATVCEAMKKGHTERQACRIALDNCIYRKPKSTTGIKAVYKRMKKRLEEHDPNSLLSSTK